MIDIRAVVQEAQDRVDADRKAIRAALEQGPPPPGLEPVDDSTFLAFVEGMMAQFPPEPMVTPEGAVIVESPWMVMCGLDNVAGGKQIVDRVLRIRRKMEAV